MCSHSQSLMLSPKKWKMLAKHGEQKTYAPGDRILSQGDVISKLYWLHRGSASITKQIGTNLIHLGVIEKYTFFGEISYLSSSTTVTVSN